MTDRGHAPAYLATPATASDRADDRVAVLRTVAQQVEAIGDRQQGSDVAASTAVLAGSVLNQEII